MKYLVKVPVILLVLISLLFANLQLNKRSGGNDVCFNICGDARGYYAWLPAVFVYHDLNFHFFDTAEIKYAPCGTATGPIQDYRYVIEGKSYDKYYPGASVMMLPFFLIAHIITITCTHLSGTGYSLLYFKIMPLAAVFYFFLGMLFFLRTMDKLGISTWVKTLVMLMLIFGTSLMYYVVDAPLYSHVYSFCLVAAFIYFTFCLKETMNIRHLSAICFLAGWIFIVRPVNVCIILMLPFVLNDSLRPLMDNIRRRPALLLALFPGIIMPLLLFILYKIATGHFIIYAYQNEGFVFTHPHIFQYLFSYDNGVLPYTPLLLMPLLLCVFWYSGEHKMLLTGILFTLLVIIYINASWWCWWFGYSFGARCLTDFLPLFGILIALSLRQMNRKKYLIILPVYLLSSMLTGFLYKQKSQGGYMSTYPVKDYWTAIHNAIGMK